MHELTERPVPGQQAPAGDWLGSAYLPAAATVRRWVAVTAAAIVALGCLREWLRLGFGIGRTSFFDLNGEQNAGAWFSATMLAACAFLLFNAGRRARAEGQRNGWFWFVIGLVFVALSIDEASSIHEMLMVPIHDALHSHGLFRYAWVVPALALVPAFALASVPFLLSLPRRTAVRFVASGAIYVTGALGFEMLGGLADPEGLVFVLSYLAEETLEIAGIVSFFFSLMDFLAIPPLAELPQPAESARFAERLIAR